MRSRSGAPALSLPAPHPVNPPVATVVWVRSAVYQVYVAAWDEFAVSGHVPDVREVDEPQAWVIGTRNSAPAFLLMPEGTAAAVRDGL